MTRTFLALTFLLFCGAKPLQDDVRVASYSTGNAGTPGYENFSFWTKDGKRAYIQYSTGKDDKDVMAAWLGSDSVHGERRFMVQIPPKRVCYIIPDGYALKVTDKNGKNRKRFTWEKEPGPDPSDTAACSICPQDEKEAMDLIRQHFLR